jgi:hypothetical protein
MLSLRAHGRVHHSISDRESIAGSTAGEEPYVILSVTVLGEMDQQRRMHIHCILVWLYASGHTETRNARSRRDVCDALTHDEHASAEP